MAWPSAFFHGQVHFYYITGFCDKKFNFCKFANFFADSISRAQELSNDQTWDLEGGGQIDPPPQHILVFNYPSRDRVKVDIFLNLIFCISTGNAGHFS